MKDAGALPASVVDEAIAWSVKLNFSSPDPGTCAAFERWRRAAPDHEQAWTRVQTVNADFSALPQGLALDTLTATTRRRRRAVLKSLAALGGLASTGWVIREHAPWQAADVSTGVGQRDRLTLADGTLLMLNTDSAVGLRMEGAERVLVLYRGEISIQTGADAASPVKRPFFVRTPFGTAQALGTRFVVRLAEAYARISVQEDAVALRPASGADRMIAQAGQTWRLDSQRALPMQTPAITSDAWLAGAIEGQDMRLGDLLAELARYRPGRISCAPEVADLKVSDTYHVDDSDRTLAFLARTLPIRLRYWTRYWVAVGPA